MKSFSRVLAVAALAVALGAPTDSLAQKKGKKGSSAEKAAPARPQPQPAAAKKEEERKGPATFKDVPKLDDAEKAALADKKRDEQIDYAKKIIPKLQDGSPQKAEMLFQLAELYWEKSKYLYAKEMHEFLQAEKVCDEKINRGEKPANCPPKASHRESELFRGQAIGLYEQILREYPAYERKDEVLFSLGYNLYDSGKREAAVKRYEELIKGYPKSKFVADTYVQLGNHYFDVANDLARARAMYEKAYASPVPKIKSYALYKLAWCDFNAGEHEKALKKLQDVVAYTENQQDRKQFTDLKNEALNDMVRMFVQLNRADDAIAYFKAHAGKKAQARLIAKMAEQLAEAGHHENAIKTFRYLIDQSPMQAKAPEFQQAIIRSYEGLRQRDQVQAEIKKLAELYRPGSQWWKANESNKDVLRNAFTVAEEAMRTIVTEYHQEAQKTKSVATYRLARDIYKQYVDAFASSEDEAFVSDSAFNMRFYYAEILWALEEWDKAAEEYEKVVVFKIPNRDDARQVSNEKYRQSAAYNAILAYGKLVQIERGVLQKSDLKENQKVDEKKAKERVQKQKQVQKRTVKELVEQPLTNWEKKLVASIDKYNQLFPNNQDEIELRYQAAVVYYDRNHFVEAAQRFTEVITKWPEDKRSQDAADLSMSVLEEKEEWLELNKIARAFAANKKLTKPGSEFTKRVAGIVEGSQYKYIDEVVYKKEKNPAKAAEEFVKFVAEFPKSNNADRALTYAMLIFKDAEQIDRGVEMGERVLKEYPDSPFELKVRFYLAQFYEQTADFEKSANMYEAFIAEYDERAGPKAIGYQNIKDLLAKETKGKKTSAPKAKKEEPKIDPKEAETLLKEAEGFLADAQFNAGLWWEGLGKSDKAIAAYQRYIQRFKDKKDVPEIAFNIALVHEKDKKWADAAKAFDSYAATYAKDNRASASSIYEARYRALLAYRKLSKQDEVEKAVKELVASYPKLPDSEKKNLKVLDAYAHARFLALEPAWNGYVNIKFNNLRTLKNDLAAKLKKIQEIEKAYTEVLAIGSGEWGIAALTRIGLAYADFAQNFLDSPNPKGLDEEQLDMYRAELENRAYPLEEKSIEALEKALGKSYELAVYNEWTLLAQDKLNKYRPGAYPKVREVAFKGSEFFATSPIAKDGAVAASAPKPAAAPVEKPQEGAKETTGRAATTAGAR